MLRTNSSSVCPTLIEKVFDVSFEKDHIGLNTIKHLDIKENDFVLFKTKNSFVETFIFDFVYVDKEAARYLKERGIKGVGIDGLGIERAQDNHPTHKILLGNDIIIIEGLRLKEVKEGIYDMVCLPLKITGVEANPARVILMD
jgi:arylformamidase